MGLESVLAKELRQHQYENINVYDGKVTFDGDLTDICFCNLWLRSAGRIYIQLGTFTAVTFDVISIKYDFRGPLFHFAKV